MVSYKRRSFIRRILFIWNYPFSKSRKQKVENEADKIAIERGYGIELVQERIYQFKIPYKTRIEKEKIIYYSPKVLMKLIEESTI